MLGASWVHELNLNCVIMRQHAMQGEEIRQLVEQTSERGVNIVVLGGVA